MQLGFYFDQSRCIGCYACVAACRSWNQLERDMPDLVQIKSKEQGKFPNPTLSYLFVTCFQCAQPACVPGSPHGLLVKRAEDGIVAVNNPEQCTDCRQCAEACPYEALKVIDGDNARVLKCNLCSDRIAAGKAAACVATCPTEALDIGPMEQLIAKYGELKTLNGFPDYRKTLPAIVFKAQKLEK